MKTLLTLPKIESDDTRRMAETTAPALTRPTLAPKRILVVDDDAHRR